jgi:hypothetical protein
MSDLKFLTEDDVAEELFTWEAPVTPERWAWLEGLGIPDLKQFVYRIDFVQMYGEAEGNAMRLHRFATNSENSRFITACPHGEQHAARIRPYLVPLAELPPKEYRD